MLGGLCPVKGAVQLQGQGGKFERGGNNLAGNLFYLAGNLRREYDGGNKLAVNFPGGKFSRRYIFLGGEMEPTRISD